MTELRNIAVDLKGDQATEVFLSPVYQDPDFRSLFRLMPSVVNRQKLAFASAMQDIMKERTGCGWNPSGQFTLSERCLEVYDVVINLEMCADEFKGTDWEYLLARGINRTDISQAEVILAIIQDRVANAIRKDLTKIAWFGNRASTNPTAKIADGMWSVYLKSIITATPSQYTNIPAAPLVLGDGIKYLQAAYDQATNELHGMPDNTKYFAVSRSIYQQLLADYESNTTNSGIWVQQISNRQVISYRGIQVIPMFDWSNLSGGGANAHYVLFTTRENLIMGSDVTDPMSQFKIWYDDKDEKLYIKVAFKIGFNYVHDSFVSIASVTL